MIKVSVVVPIYNVEKYLSECLESLIKQTYTEIEIILVDDGSKDASGIICDKYKERDSRIQVYHEKNGGPARARNYGLKKASGNYVMFVDADDWIEETTIQNCVRQIEDTGIDLVLFNMCDFEESEKREYHLLNGEIRCFKGKDVEYIENMLLTFQAENLVDTTSLRGPVCKMYKKDIAKECYFPEDMTWGEDTCFVQQYFRKINSIVYIDKVFYYRRVLATSLSHAMGQDYIEKRLKFVNWTLKFYKGNKSYELLNRFCFCNYISVFNYIHANSQKGVFEKNRLLKQFLTGIEFSYDFSELKVDTQNKNVNLIQSMLRKRRLIVVVMLLLEVVKIKNRILRR